MELEEEWRELYPIAINDFVSKGGFPQLLMNPVNFEALYAQKLAALKEKTEAGQ